MQTKPAQIGTGAQFTLVIVHSAEKHIQDLIRLLFMSNQLGKQTLLLL